MRQRKVLSSGRKLRPEKAPPECIAKREARVVKCSEGETSARREVATLDLLTCDVRPVGLFCGDLVLRVQGTRSAMMVR